MMWDHHYFLKYVYYTVSVVEQILQNLFFKLIICEMEAYLKKNK